MVPLRNYAASYLYSWNISIAHEIAASAKATNPLGILPGWRLASYEGTCRNEAHGFAFRVCNPSLGCDAPVFGAQKLL